MSAGLLLTALGLGIRHGFDLDHFVAIADLGTVTRDRRRGILLSLAYALGHAAVVLVLGVALIELGVVVPRAVDRWMPRLVGASLVVLGGWALVETGRRRGEARLRSRTTVLVDAAAAGWRSLRPATGAATEAQGPRAPGAGVAVGVGALHGIGFESPTQIALFVASTTVVGREAALTLLFAWVGGLVVANGILALALCRGSGGGARTAAVRTAGAVLVSSVSVLFGSLLVLGHDVGF